MPMMGGVYSGLSYAVVNMDNPQDASDLDDKLNTLVGANRQDEVVAITMMPLDFVDDESPSYAPVYKSKSVTRGNTIGNYTPRNKKLLTYPYFYLNVDTLNDSKDYRFEYASTAPTLTFEAMCSLTPNPEIMVEPKNYNGNNGMNPIDRVICSGFPQCAFVIDSYRAWLAQKSVQGSFSVASGLLSAIGSFLTPSNRISTLNNPVTNVGGAIGATQGLMSAGSALIDNINDGAGSDTARGNITSATDVGTLRKNIYFRWMGVTEQSAKMIDDFFDRFGYTTKRIKIPNRNVRPHWTYTKTVDVAIRGNVPVDDMRKIKAIYNNGITFWRNGSEVGNYSLDNTV